MPRQRLRPAFPPEMFSWSTFPTWPTASGHQREIEARIRKDGVEQVIRGMGTGPIDAFVDALHKHCGVKVDVADYREHAVKSGSGATAAAYVEANVNGKPLFGVGIDSNIVSASLIAVVSAVNRAVRAAN